MRLRIGLALPLALGWASRGEARERRGLPEALGAVIATPSPGALDNGGSSTLLSGPEG